MADSQTTIGNRDRALLGALGEKAGTLSGEAAVAAWGFIDRREKAREAVKRLKTMERAGLVKRLDDLRPLCWLRTAAGTEATTGG